MERETFVLPTGVSFVAWDLRFGTPQRHVETKPVTHHERNGTVSRHGTARETIETAPVKFLACQGSIHSGQKGQLSSTGDQFFDVTILSAEALEEHALITGQASRVVDMRFEWDRQ
jgi:hypothetical protein